MFARTLVELGKEYELKFYLSELERLYSTTELPEFGYQIGVIYSLGSFSNFSIARSHFEKVIRFSTDKDLRTKAKMFLAGFYDSMEDLAACRKLVDSMEEPQDKNLHKLYLIWQAKVLKDENKIPQSQKILDGILESNSITEDWYAYFSANVIQVSLYLKKGEKAKAQKAFSELKETFKGRNFKSLMVNLGWLEKQIAEEGNIGSVQWDDSEDVIILKYKEKKIEIERRTSVGKVIKQLLKRETLNKQAIIKILYERPYEGENDNKLIYYHIHTLRKELEKIGLSGNCIEKNEEGYRFVPEVKTLEGGNTP